MRKNGRATVKQDSTGKRIETTVRRAEEEHDKQNFLNRQLFTGTKTFAN